MKLSRGSPPRKLSLFPLCLAPDSWIGCRKTVESYRVVEYGDNAMALLKKRYTPEEYFAIERESALRHELLDGEVYAMSGASPEHERIVGDTHISLNGQIRGKGYEIFLSNLRLKLNKGTYFYGDLSVVCGEPLFVLESGLKSLINPTLVIEVLSPSASDFDRGEKFRRYQTIESLQEYVLINQQKPVVEVDTRQLDGKWLYASVQGLDATTALESIGCTLRLADVYERVTVIPFDDDIDQLQ